MFKNKLFWKIFTSFISLLSLGLALIGYFVSKVIKGHYSNQLTGSPESDIKTIILYILLTFAITLVIGFVLLRINTSPLLNITRIAQNFARGNFARKAEIASSDEMGDLANAINTMGIELQSRMQTILDDKNKLDAIMLTWVMPLLPQTWRNELSSSTMQQKPCLAYQRLFWIKTICGKR